MFQHFFRALPGLRSIRQAVRVRQGTLAWLIATRVWLALTSLFLVFNILILLQERSAMRQQTRTLLGESNLYLSLRFNNATARIFEVLEAINLQLDQASDPQVIKADQYADLKAVLPLARIRVLSSASLRHGDPEMAQARPLLTHQAIAAPLSIGVQREPNNSITYLLDAPNRQSHVCFTRHAKASSRLLAVDDQLRLISACWKTGEFIRYIGYERIIAYLASATSGPTYLNLRGSSSLSDSSGVFFLAGTNGNIFLPASQELIETRNHRIISFADASQRGLSTSAWLKVSAYMKTFHARPDGSTSFDTIQINGKPYLIQALRLGPYWNSAMLLPASRAYGDDRHHLILLLVLQLAALILVSVVIIYTSQLIARPISAAIAAINRLSLGDFSVDLQGKASGELQSLYSSIRDTAHQLKLLVADKLGNALRNQQLSTARDIQQKFLPANSCETASCSVAASFTPAYEIGADWYDIITVGELIFVVVADVCDKGVPSALFMSVFRSLLRYTLDDGCASDHLDIDAVLSGAMERVNAYMAKTHAAQAMFATVFLAAVDPRAMRVHYVSAGHEPTQLISGYAISELESNSPAVGIFANARFRSQSLAIHPGDILFAYTDGVTDAVNADGQRWGKQRLQQLLLSMAGETRPGTLIEAVHGQVDRFIAGCDQFDDLTMLALVVKT